MKLTTVIFWQLIQAVVLMAMGAIENITPWLMAVAPALVWEVMLMLVIGGNAVWMLAAIGIGESGTVPRVNVGASVKSRVFPAPPAARYATNRQTTKRQRRVVP